MQYGLDIEQFRIRVVRLVLMQLELHSPAAENLVLGTGMQESRLSYLQQIKGPARGLFQMELATYKDLWENFLINKAVLANKVENFAIGFPDFEEMEGNLYFATAMCRICYYRIKEALPANNPLALAQYWKKYYNTALGKGTIEQALPHFKIACMHNS